MSNSIQKRVALKVKIEKLTTAIAAGMASKSAPAQLVKLTQDLQILSSRG